LSGIFQSNPVILIRKLTYKQTKNFGEIIDIHAPEIGGVRYNAAGEFIGFLEP